MSKHTPGPWNNLPRHECVPICRQDDAGLSIGFVHSSDPERQAQGLANAFLIAAAPDLLEALETFREAFVMAVGDNSPFAKCALSDVDAVISKARGEA